MSGATRHNRDSGGLAGELFLLIVLYEPEIPPNTGNIARLCAAFDVELHLIEPLGFSLEDKYMKRAGLDYWPHVKMCTWPDWETFTQSRPFDSRLVLATTKASKPVQTFDFKADDGLVFGPETRGLPDAILAAWPWQVRIPTRNMAEGGVRSLNLSSACAIVLYAALEHCGMLGAPDIH